MHHKIQDVDKVKEKLKDDVMTSQSNVSYIKVVNKQYGTFFTFLNRAKQNYIKGFKEKPIFILENVANMAPIVSNRTNEVEYEGSVVDESAMSFTVKNIDLVMSNMMKNCKKTGNFKAIRPNLLKLVKRANSLEDIRVLRQDVGTVPYTMEKMAENRPDIAKQCREHSKWINDVYKPAINERAKEIRNSVTESTSKYNDEDLQDHDGIAAIIVDKQGRLLVQDHIKYDFWTVPVGKVKHHETVEEGLLTEMKEELNIKPTKYHELFSTKKTYDRDGIPVTVNQHVFFITAYEGTIRNNEPEKHRSIKWMSVSELNKQEKLSDATKNYLEYVKDNGGKMGVSTELIPVYVLLTYTNSLMAKAIKVVTNQPYSHAGISLDSSMKHIFTYGRKEIKDVCKFTDENIFDGALGAVKDKTPYSLYVTFFEKPQFETLKDRIENIKNDVQRHGYSYKGLINFALGKETYDDYRMFCSQFVADVIKAGDPKRVKKHTSRYSPSDLSKVKGMHFVTKGILGNYDQKKVDEAVNKLRSSLSLNNAKNVVIESAFDDMATCTNCGAYISQQFSEENYCFKCKEEINNERDIINTLCENGLMMEFVNEINNTEDVERLRNCLESMDDLSYINKIRNRISVLENSSCDETEKCLYIIIESTDTRLVNNRLNIFNVSDNDTIIYTVEECKEGTNVSFNVDKYRRKGLSLSKEECDNTLPVLESGRVQVSYKITSSEPTYIDNICENFNQVKAWKPMVPMTSLVLSDSIAMESYAVDMIRSIGLDDDVIDIERIK